MEPCSVRPAIIVMTRAPVPGAAKTRLQAVLSPQQCAELHEAFLLDTLDLAGRFEKAALFLAFTPAESFDYFEKRVPGSIVLLPQMGRSLGERMHAGIQKVCSEGFGPVVVVGSDSPTLPLKHLESAFAALGSADVCLGPSRDGGYYLIGVREPQPELFEEMSWGENDVFARTLQRARGVGLKTSILPSWYDVDTPDDLIYLRAELAELRKLPEAFIPPKTEAFLQNQLKPVP